MKIIIAPDSFKGTLSSAAVIDIVSQAAAAVFPDAILVPLPIADGGEGTVEAVARATGCPLCAVTVRGPYGAPVRAQYGVVGGNAVLEMASASGLTLAPSGALDPMIASSYGTGELIAHALERGHDILLGIGGSATNDGGSGMLEALGARFYDANGDAVHGSGAALSAIERIDLAGLHPALATARITVLCDVRHPLLGPDGATRVFGPQKGATPEMLDALEAGMARYAQRMAEAIRRDVSAMPGAGAAGGLGFALAGVLGARLQPGIETLLDLIGFDRHLAGASFVVTGEGRIDAQSSQGKVADGIARRSAAQGVPVAILAGAMAPGAEAFLAREGVSIMTSARGPEPLATLMENAAEYLRDAALRMFRFVAMGRDMRG